MAKFGIFQLNFSHKQNMTRIKDPDSLIYEMIVNKSLHLAWTVTALRYRDRRLQEKLKNNQNILRV